VSKPHALRAKVIDETVRAVTRVSSAKGGQSPVLGSKLLHFLLPEFFPVWDGKRVGKALAHERRADGTSYDGYAGYLELMLADFAKVADGYEEVKSEYMRGSEIDRPIMDWHFGDLGPAMFEICLISKHPA
jgi:hypothetical protein